VRLKYPFPFMAIGDRFEVPEGCEQKVRAAAVGYRKWHSEFDFSVKRDTDGKFYCERVEKRFRADIQILPPVARPPLDQGKRKVFGDSGPSKVGRLRVDEWFEVRPWELEKIRGQAIGLHERWDGDYQLFKDGDRTVCLCLKTSRDA